MNIMTKRGNLDNIVTYEHICDTQEDLANIPLQYTTLGSVALVIKGDDDALEAYMATSNGEWVPIMMNSGSGGGSGCYCQHLVLQEGRQEESPKKSSTTNTYILNYTFAQIEDALQNGTVVFNSEVIDDSDEEESSEDGGSKSVGSPSAYITTPVQIGYNSDQNYYFVTALGVINDEYTWGCGSKNDYPSRLVNSEDTSDDENDSSIIK